MFLSKIHFSNENKVNVKVRQNRWGECGKCVGGGVSSKQPLNKLDMDCICWVSSINYLFALCRSPCAFWGCQHEFSVFRRASSWVSMFSHGALKGGFLGVFNGSAHLCQKRIYRPKFKKFWGWGESEVTELKHCQSPRKSWMTLRRSRKGVRVCLYIMLEKILSSKATNRIPQETCSGCRSDLTFDDFDDFYTIHN